MHVRIIELNCRCGASFNLRIKNPSLGHLFVRFKCHARVLTSEGYREASPGDFIFYRAEEEMAYGTENERFSHDYFRFYLEEGEQELLSLPTETLFKAPISEKMEELLQMMMREFYSANEEREQSLSLLGRLFLLGARERINGVYDPRGQRVREELLSVRVEMLSSPERDWTVELLAERARLSPSYFQSVYKKTFGKSPINDLIEARINKAESYLLSSSKKETEIATLCGYKNVEHFIRQFKGLKGASPSLYRLKQ